MKKQQEREPHLERRGSAYVPWRRWIFGALGAASSLAFLRLSFAQAPASDSKAPHGALAMSGQSQLLAPWVAPTVAVPKGVYAEFWRTLVPLDNPGNLAQVSLGRKLYFEPRLSKDGSVACATCHDVSRGFTDRRNTSDPRPHTPAAHAPRRQCPLPRHAVYGLALALRAGGHAAAHRTDGPPRSFQPARRHRRWRRHGAPRRTGRQAL